MEVSSGRDSGEDFVTRFELPKDEWVGIWESIYVDEMIKNRIINFGLLEHRLSGINFDKRSLSHHGAILLSGPPGTGKTSLAKGAANELSRELDMETVYKEINVQRLFSSGFGDTPTLVEEAFQEIIEPAELGSTFQILLLDEVESIFSSRDMLGSNDPFDAIRAVNEALRQLDKIAEVDDVYVVATSNQPSGIDRAFYDRTDEQLFVGNPRAEHRASIFEEIFEELNTTFETELPTNSSHLKELLDVSQGFSGRRIRKTVLSSLTRDATINQPEELSYEDIIDEFRDKREMINDGDRDYVELGIDPDESSIHHHDKKERNQTDTSDLESTGNQGKEGVTPDDMSEPTSASAADHQSSKTLSADTNGDSEESDQSSGSVNPRTVVMDRTKQNPDEQLRQRVTNFFSEVLEKVGIDNEDLQSVMMSDDLEELWYRLCMARDLQRIQFAVADVAIPVNITYDHDANNRLTVPSPDVFSGAQHGGPVKITLVATRDEEDSVDISTDSDDVILEMKTVNEGGDCR